VGEAAVKPSVVLDNLVHATTMVIYLRHSFGVSAGAYLCGSSPGLRFSSRRDRKSWGRHAQHGRGGERQSKFSHLFSSWVNVGGQTFAPEYSIWKACLRSPNYKNHMEMKQYSSEHEVPFTE
jgi:hypothetical protein